MNGIGTYTQRRRRQMAGGGITNVRPRQGYFLGELVDKVKNVVSPILQYAEPITGIARYVGDLMNIGSDAQAAGNQPIKTVPGPQDYDWGTPPINPVGGGGPDVFKMSEGTPPWYSDKIWRELFLGSESPELTGQEPGILQKIGQTIIPGGETGYFDLYGGLTSPSQIGDQQVQWKIPLGIGLAAGELQRRMSEGDVLPKDETGINIADIRRRALTGSDPDLHFLPPASATTAYADGGRIGFKHGSGIGSLEAGAPDIKYEGDMRMASAPDPMDALNDMSMNVYGKPLHELTPEQYQMLIDMANEQAAMPGRDRVMAQEGGLMDLGGMEKDYRQEGGFVPIGAEEKADDVPARLSKNEFVFTADAVRAAGGGDIDKGAAVMENLMENLEAGGKVSEESQGLEGAQAMFANTQKLQNRII